MTLQEVENYYRKDSYSYIFEALSIIEDIFDFCINNKSDNKYLNISCKSEYGDILYIRNALIGDYTFIVSFKDAEGIDSEEKVFRDEIGVYKYIQNLFGLQISNS